MIFQQFIKLNFLTHIGSVHQEDGSGHSVAFFVITILKDMQWLKNGYFKIQYGF